MDMLLSVVNMLYYDAVILGNPVTPPANHVIPTPTLPLPVNGWSATQPGLFSGFHITTDL